MLVPLSRLPFKCAFDILFVHGGLSRGLGRVYRGKWLFVFLERLYGKDNQLWTDILCACHLVRCLEFPEQAIFLLHPKEPSILDSVSAWSVSNRFSEVEFQLPVRKDLMVRAMRVFVDFNVRRYDWLDPMDLNYMRSPKGWSDFASECVRNYQFSIWWWKTQGIAWWDGPSMKHAIHNVAHEEAERLESALVRAEKKRILDIKRAKLNQDPKKKIPTKPVRLTFADEQTIRYEVERNVTQHQSMMQEVKHMLEDSISTRTLDGKFPRIARIVMGLTRQYPKLKWSLKWLFHQVIEDRLCLDTWCIERELCRQQHFEDPDPLYALRLMAC